MLQSISSAPTSANFWACLATGHILSMCFICLQLRYHCLREDSKALGVIQLKKRTEIETFAHKWIKCQHLIRANNDKFRKLESKYLCWMLKLQNNLKKVKLVENYTKRFGQFKVIAFSRKYKQSRIMEYLKKNKSKGAYLAKYGIDIPKKHVMASLWYIWYVFMWGHFFAHDNMHSFRLKRSFDPITYPLNPT